MLAHCRFSVLSFAVLSLISVQDGSEAGSVKRSVSEDGLQFVHSGALQSVQSGGLQSIQSGGLQSVHSEGLPSTQSGAIQSSGSGAPQSAQSGLQSGQAASLEPADVTQLRTQFQLQRDKLKRMEQKNYVSRCMQDRNLVQSGTE